MTTTQALLDSLLTHKASINLATTEQKNQALSAMADQLVAQTEVILAGNAIDMENAQGEISQVMQDRLLLTAERIEAMADGIRALIGLPDPVGLVLEEFTRADGLNIRKKSIPFGLVGMIYESRPNVTSDAAPWQSRVETQSFYVVARKPFIRLRPLSQPQGWFGRGWSFSKGH